MDTVVVRIKLGPWLFWVQQDAAVLLPVTRQTLTDIQNYFIFRLCSKFATESLLTLLRVKKYLVHIPESELYYYYIVVTAGIVLYVSPVANGYSAIYVVRTTYLCIPFNLRRHICRFTSERVKYTVAP